MEASAALPTFTPRALKLTGQLSRIPWINYDPLWPANIHSHPSTEPRHPTEDPNLRQESLHPRWKTLKQGYGSRHIFDIAPFSLWDDANQCFRNPKKDESQWIFAHYRAKQIRLEYPIVLIVTDTVPNPLPLTVACVAVRFVPSAPISTMPYVNTAYASPRVPDPMSSPLGRWANPTNEEAAEIIRILSTMANIKAINWVGPYCYVELCTDNRVYERRSLPGYVAGKSTTYHHSAVDFWKDIENNDFHYIFDPQEYAEIGVQDDTNYLQHGWGILHPGVKIASSHDPLAGIERNSTCGVRLQNERGEVVVTVANHSVMDSDDVYHPSIEGSRIGQVVERWQAQDVAMVALTPAVCFTNSEYFQATAPQRLLRSNQVREGSWCSADGITTGVIFLQCVGIRVGGIEGVASGITIEAVQYHTEKIYAMFGALDGKPMEGICGAPIVEESCSLSGAIGGGISGFFQFGNSQFAMSPVLDEIIDSGWELY
ncbi:hypothetical protein PRK78_004714 [Emydomyces testavorans]|uniref:Uncharacterized protein n=1 Tax=Emydomyces testavorans TaxID=2070801 RepID=A0AAF0IIV1_9EURO|nr:hypothetical protein PRK78_004714 [Emydomyces testavorans]